MYEFWHDYVKPKTGEKAKLCHKDADRFIVYIETEDIYLDIAKDVCKKDIANYELDRPFPK